MKRSILIVGLALMSIGCTESTEKKQEEPSLGEINHELPMWERVIGKWKVANSDEYDYIVFSEKKNHLVGKELVYYFLKKGSDEKYEAEGIYQIPSYHSNKMSQDTLLCTYYNRNAFIEPYYRDSLCFKNKKELVYVSTNPYSEKYSFKYILHK